MTKNNSLPEFWAVVNDRSKEFEKVLKHCRNIEPLLTGKANVYGDFFRKGKSNGYLGTVERFKKDYPNAIILSPSEFISLTEEKEEWKPKDKEWIMVDSGTGCHKRMFSKMDEGKFSCVSEGYENLYLRGQNKYFVLWPKAKPFVEPFTPTVGKVAYMKAEGDEDNFVFIGKLGDKFMGCNIDEYDDLIKNFGGEVFLFDSVEPARDLTKEVSFSEVAQKFDTTVDKLKIKGYVNEQDAVEDVIKQMKSFTIPANLFKTGDVIEFAYSIPFKMDPGIKSIFTIISS
jgi:hypothetical protein